MLNTSVIGDIKLYTLADDILVSQHHFEEAKERVVATSKRRVLSK